MDIVIRRENTRDQEAVFSINVAAFETDAEAQLVAALSKGAIPTISLVALDDDKIIGHILFSPALLSAHPGIKIMGLAPMAVLPGCQRQGVGSKLVRAGLHECKELGIDAVIVLGHPGYYPKFGFRPASQFRIDSDYEVPDDVFMAIEIQAGALNGISGRVHYHQLFNSLD